MSNTPDRLWDLLADRASQGLSEAESRELTQLLRENPDIDPLALESAAAAVSLAFLEPQPLPAAVRQRLEMGAQAWAQENAARQEVAEAPAPIAVIRGGRGVLFAGWIAAAACLAFALAGWWSSIQPPLPVGESRVALLKDLGTKKADWSEWKDGDKGAVVANVRGDVVWNESEQKGYMKFTGLPANDPTKQQYQLWIVDERGMGQRISGGIFNIPASPSGAAGEVVVPITPQIRTRGAAAFALTVEEPGGTWVSTMERRVVIATIPKG